MNCREYEAPKVDRAMAVREFDRFAEAVRSSLSINGGEVTTSVPFRGDVWRQHLAERGTPHRANYRRYESTDLQPLISRSLLQESYHYKLRDLGYGLSVLFPLHLKWQVKEQMKNVYIRNKNGDLEPCPSAPVEMLYIKVASTATDGHF